MKITLAMKIARLVAGGGEESLSPSWHFLLLRHTTVVVVKYHK